MQKKRNIYVHDFLFFITFFQQRESFSFCLFVWCMYNSFGVPPARFPGAPSPPSGGVEGREPSAVGPRYHRAIEGKTTMFVASDRSVREKQQESFS